MVNSGLPMGVFCTMSLDIQLWPCAIHIANPVGYKGDCAARISEPQPLLNRSERQLFDLISRNAAGDHVVLAQVSYGAMPTRKDLRS